jgi:DNA-binding IclR family transcriptional regulator
VLTRDEKHGVSRPGYPIGSVDNALKLLLAFREKPRIRLSEASVYLGVAHSTAHRLLAMLAYHGFVQQEESTKAYIAGPALLEVGLAVVNRMDIRSIARPILVDLKERFGETVHLAVLEGTKVRYLDCIESDKALRVAGRTGTLLPAHCTSVGKALLATLPPEDLQSLYPEDGELGGQTASSITTFDQLRQELEVVRKQGYATNQAESEEGVASVAVAVLDSRGHGLATLSVAGPVSRMNTRRMKEISGYLRKQSEQLAQSIPA